MTSKNQPPESLSTKNRPLANRQLSDTPANQPLKDDEQQALLAELPAWHIAGKAEDKQVRRTFQFVNYADALKFTADIGSLAEQSGHYPTIITTYQKVTVMWHTAESGNLQLNDFILAAKTSELITGG